MKTSILPILSAALLLVLGCASDRASGIKKMPDLSVQLYPEGAPDSNGLDPQTEGLQSCYTQIGNNPVMNFFFPDKPNGQMVIIIPGGGYRAVSAFGGLIAANWFNERGITACVLEYRLPNGHPEIPLEDVRYTMRYCRKHAPSWGVSQIGVVGDSAGGHIAALASNCYTDQITRPDFTVLLYSLVNLVESDDDEVLGYLLGENCSMDYRSCYSADRLVTSGTPPSYIACNEDDPIVPYHNSELYRDALTRCGVPVEFHCYKTGFHGWGFNSAEYCDLLNADNQGYYALRDTVGTCYQDIMEPWREDFESSLTLWLDNLRK